MENNQVRKRRLKASVPTGEKKSQVKLSQTGKREEARKEKESVQGRSTGVSSMVVFGLIYLCFSQTELLKKSNEKFQYMKQ